MFNRRSLLMGGAAMLALGGLRAAYARPSLPMTDALFPDARGLLDLPKGFTYAKLSVTGQIMGDGMFTPGRFDGMGAFAGPGGRIILVRNHEVGPNHPEVAYERGKAPRGAYNPMAAGGTTTLLLSADGTRVERDFMSLAGTDRNCAGGTTPWGSWLSCEEPKAGDKLVDGHGWVFEVPSGATAMVEAVPLKALGRMNHEAALVDPASGIVYLSEDRDDGLFYRFLPNAKGELAKGGTLQAAVVADTANSANRDGDWKVDAARPVRWIDIEPVEAPDDEIRHWGAARGATKFVRGEGLARAADGTVFLSCTEGGGNAKGQIFAYSPTSGSIRLYVEPNDIGILDMPDNMVVAPWGGLVVCEDSKGDNFIRVVMPDGRVRPFARNAHEGRNEFCGACFSPDGRTLFVNVQSPGMTYAITGDWAGYAAA